MRDIVVTEKLDGTNAQILIDETGTKMTIGSRNRIITPEDDNYGFARWCKDNEAELLKLGPGRHFGEWWGAGIQRRYSVAEKRFSLFNVGRWKSLLTPSIPGVFEGNVDGGIAGPLCCYVVPTLYEGPFNMALIDAALAQLKEHGSVAAPGFLDPEGIVILHKASGTLFKRTVKNDESPKGMVAS
ncbi:MAG: RNA ligase family protein [Candidatus Peribacteraceae bacterium]|nr:RNA ligase family protein [Candidatus Peribacteraceae bacterium]